MSENIFGPGSNANMAGYLLEIPITDNVTDIGRAAKRYRRTYTADLECSTINGSAVPAGAPVGSTGASTNGDLASFSGVSGQLIQDSGIVAVHVVQNAAGVNGNVVEFGATPQTLVDSGTAFSALLTSATAATTYIPYSGATGNLAMGAHNITNVGAITASSAVLNIGQTNATSGTSYIAIGNNNAAGGSSGGQSVVVGGTNDTSGSSNGQSIIFGTLNADSNAAGGAFMFGSANTNGTGQRNILIGRNNTVPNGVNDGMVMGFNGTNNTSSSLLVGVAANIRTGSTTCDLGTTGNPFQTLYLNANVHGPTNSRAVDDILSCATNGVSGDIATFTGTAKVVQDSGTALSSLQTSAAAASTYVPYTGATGDLAMGTHNVTGVTNLNSLIAANLTTDSGTASSGNVTTYTGNKTIHDSGTALSALLTSAAATSTYVPYTGATTDLAMGTHNIAGVGTLSATGIVSGSGFTSSAPSFASAYSSAGAAISFTGGTGKLIAASFAQSSNPVPGDWVLTTASGLYTYNGSATRWYRVMVEFSLVPQSSTNSCQFWVTQGGSLTPVDWALYNFDVTALSPDYITSFCSRNLQMATGNTVQFAGLVTGGSPTIPFKSIKITVIPIS